MSPKTGNGERGNLAWLAAACTTGTAGNSKPGEEKSPVTAPAHKNVETQGVVQLIGKLQALTPPAVKDGPFAFALSVNIAGAQRPNPGGEGLSPPVPDEWRKATESASGPLRIPDGIVDQAWKD